MQRSLANAVTRLQVLGQQVKQHGACSLPGVSIDYKRLEPLVHRAVARGFVTVEHARFVLKGLWFGFDLGIDVAKMRGRRWFRNYASAEEHRAQVTAALRDRVRAAKTVALCKCAFRDARLLPWDVCRVFPLGAVKKPLEPDAVRPVSDHTVTGLKEATDLESLKHTLGACEEIQSLFGKGSFMRMMDVAGAFPLLPLAPHLWIYFLCWWYTVDEAGHPDEMWLYAHLTGDFGAAGMPGTWKIFFTDVMIGVARSEGVLTLPMPVYVDDCAAIGPVAAQVDAEGIALRDWLESLGVTMKKLKERAAATLQLALGFWWDSIARTRTLEEKKLHAYIAQLREFAGRSVLTLREMQQVGGRMQRAVLTLPRGAMCFLATLFALMRGLSFPWQRRRTSRVLRADFAVVADLLEANQGGGLFAFDHLERAPAVYTDASKESRYAGGGYISMCGKYRWWFYGGATSRQPIDFLEGDAVLLAAMDLAPSWAGKLVPLYIDNRSFQLSAVKGWSKAARLYMQLRTLFLLSVKYECVFEFHWISTHDNVLADALSRKDGEPLFLRRVADMAPLDAGCSLQRHESSGLIRKFGKEYSSDITGDGHLTAAERGDAVVRVAPGKGLGLFARVPLAKDTPVARMMMPCWDNYERAVQRALRLGQPHDSVPVGTGGWAAYDLSWGTASHQPPMWYRLNHAHATLANTEMRDVMVDGCRMMVWYTRRAVEADEELCFPYDGDYSMGGSVDPAWNRDAYAAADRRSETGEHHILTGKRSRSQRTLYDPSSNATNSRRVRRTARSAPPIDSNTRNESYRVSSSASPGRLRSLPRSTAGALHAPVSPEVVHLPSSSDEEAPAEEIASACNHPPARTGALHLRGSGLMPGEDVAPFTSRDEMFARMLSGDLSSARRCGEALRMHYTPSVLGFQRVSFAHLDAEDCMGALRLCLLGAKDGVREVVLRPHSQRARQAVLRFGRNWPDARDNGVSRGTSKVAFSVPYSRASIFVGLPSQGLATRADEIMDSRLAESSQASISAALGHWRVLCGRHRWPEVIASDDPSRGGKMASFMIYMVDETELAGTSILNYTWALRAYMKHSRQLDPVMGVIEWDDWSQAVSVVAWVPSEPRRMVPLSLIEEALKRVDVSSFKEVQAACMMLMLLYTFARSETPCPKTLDGFDEDQHLMVTDVRFAAQPFRLLVRLKRIKQDQRIERPEARGDGDWIWIGDTPDHPLFSIKVWTQRLFALHGAARRPNAPFFVAPEDRQQPLTYQTGMRHVRELWEKASSHDEAMKYGLHSLRRQGHGLHTRQAWWRRGLGGGSRWLA